MNGNNGRNEKSKLECKRTSTLVALKPRIQGLLINLWLVFMANFLHNLKPKITP